MAHVYPAIMVYPTPPVHPGDVPVYLPNGSPAENTAIQGMWQMNRRGWHKDANMSEALVKKNLTLLPQ